MSLLVHWLSVWYVTVEGLLTSSWALLRLVPWITKKDSIQREFSGRADCLRILSWLIHMVFALSQALSWVKLINHNLFKWQWLLDCSFTWWKSIMEKIDSHYMGERNRSNTGRGMNSFSSQSLISSVSQLLWWTLESLLRMLQSLLQ